MIHKIIISINAKSGLWKVKNINDHNIFKTNWIQKNHNAFLCIFLIPFLIKRKSDIPIKIKSAVHTGPNARFGAVRVGLASVAYRVAIDGVVKSDPMEPANNGIAKHITSVRNRLFFFAVFFFIEGVKK